MSEWWTYRPSDLLLFSPQTYYRLFEIYNTDVWPVHILSLVLGITVASLAQRNPVWYGRMTAVILVLSWLWVAWAYHYQRYATINWAAVYYAAGFIIEAVLLVWLGVIRDRLVTQPGPVVIKRIGLGIFLFALFGQPLIGVFAGRTWLQTELFGVAPDPTVIATLGMLLVLARNKDWVLLVVPVLWCLISGTTLWVMKSPEAYAMLAIGFAAIALAIARCVIASRTVLHRGDKIRQKNK